MLVVEMQRSFLQKTKSLDRTEIRDLQSFDILALLNQAQDLLINELLIGKNYEALRPLIDDATVLSAAFVASGTYDPGVDGSSVVDLDAQASFRNFIRSQSKITRTAVPAVSDKYVQNDFIDPFEVYKFESNGSNKPVFTNPKQWQEGDYLVVLPDAYTTISAIYVVYLKTPTELVLSTPTTDTSDLPAHLHERIVDLAVRLSGEIYSNANNEE